uniref:Uncharacterized protein n=1 Tax=Panthera tigris altaica TaxID=74533 RepID=A0A8C9M5G8_PANTA
MQPSTPREPAGAPGTRGMWKRDNPLPAATRAFNFERPCYLRGGICLKQGTPDCEPFRGPCRAFTVCCKVKGLWGRAAAEKP